MCLIWARFTVAQAVCSSSFPLVCHCQLHKILVHFCIVHGCGKDQRRHTHTMRWHNGIMTTIFFYGTNTHNMCAHKHKLTNVTLSFFRGCFLCSSLLLCVCAKHQNPIRFIWEREQKDAYRIISIALYFACFCKESILLYVLCLPFCLCLQFILSAL